MLNYILKRKCLLLILLALFLVSSLCLVSTAEADADAPRQAVEPEYKWRFGDAFSAEARHKGFELFAELVEAFTDGRVEITFYPDGILGTHTELFHAVQAGDVEMMMIFPYVDIVPGGALNWMNWGCINWAEADRQYSIPDGPIYKIMQDAYNEVGVQGLWGSGFGLYGLGSNKRPLIEPSDLRGQKFRVSASLGYVETLKNMGSGLSPAFTVVTLPWADIYGSLERRVVDGVWSMWTSLVEERHGEVLTYYSDVNFGWDWYGVIMNKPLWDELPQDIQEAITKASKITQDWSAYYMQRKTLESIEKVQEEFPHLEITFLTPEQRDVWSEKANLPAVWEKVADPWLEKMYPGENMSEKLQAELQQIREDLKKVGVR